MDTAGAVAIGQRCRVCGCSDFDACMTDDGPCWWVEEDLCSGCDDSDGFV